MPIDRDALLHWSIPEIRHVYSERDTMLYALGLGFGATPEEPRELDFVYEARLRALPMMSVILGYPGLWIADPRTGVNWKELLHGEQGFTILKPLPPAGCVIGRTRVTDVIDKGIDKGALVFSQRDVTDEATGDLLCRLHSTSVLRADGGFGGPSGPTPSVHVLPQGEAHHVCDISTGPQSALIYRLSGDYNPLHVDPEIAKTARFPRPILHGLCTFGIAGHALIRAVCGYEEQRLIAMHARFTAPVFPGETIRTEMWVNGEQVSFRSTVLERQVVALNNGIARVSPS
jgi:acyl dehydratase